jgi:hypothetical protein
VVQQLPVLYSIFDHSTLSPVSACRTLRSSPIGRRRSCFRNSFLRFTAPEHVTVEIVEIPTSFVPTYPMLILVWGTVYDFKHVSFRVSMEWKQSLKKALHVLSSVCLSTHHHITCLHGMTYCLLIRLRGFLGMLCMLVHRWNTEGRIIFPFLEIGSGWQLSFCLCLDPLVSKIGTQNQRIRIRFHEV